MIIDTLLSSTNPNPVQNGIVWDLFADDYQTVNSEFPNAQFTITSTPVPANGTVLTIFGQKIKTGTTNNNDTFIWDNDPSVTYQNVIDALNRNWILSYNFTTNIVSSTTTILTFLITWKTKGYVAEFDNDSTIAAFVIDNETRGVNSEYVEGYQCNAQLFQIKSFGEIPVSPVVVCPPLLGIGAVVSVPLDFQDDIKPLLSNELVFYTQSAIFDDKMFGCFFLKYGAQKYDVDGCGAVSLGAAKSDNVFVLNAAIQYNDQLGMSRYIFDYDDSDNYASFLNVRKHGRMLSDEAANLYFWLSESMTTMRYKVMYQPYVNGLSQTIIMKEYIPQNTPIEFTKRVLAFPVGFSQTSSAYMDFSSEVDSFEVWIEAKRGLLGSYRRVSEVRTFFRDDCNCEKTELYFRGDTGCLETIRFDHVEEESFNVTQNEIALDVRKGLGFVSTMQSGNIQTNTKANEKITLLAKRKFGPTDIEFFKQFQKSEFRFIRAKSETGAKYAAKFIIESSEIVTFKKGDDVELRVKGWLAQPIL